MNLVAHQAQLRMFFIVTIFLLSSPHIFSQVGPSVKPTIHEEKGGPQTRVDSLFCLMPNVIYIDFMEGFNDTVYIFRNNIGVDTLSLITNESIGFAGGTGFGYNNNDSIYLSIQFKKSGLIIRERLKLNYKHLEIRYLGSWGFYYSNHFPILE
jgi:hypothetical protein